MDPIRTDNRHDEVDIHGPLVSIITIFYQAERFLGEAIESVISQSYSNWELLLIDDGSSDGGTTLARSYAARFPDKIRYFEHENHENRGTGPSRNLGLEAARGEFVTFLDSDDLFLAERIERHTRVLMEHRDVGIVIGSELYWYSWNRDNSDQRNRRSNYVLRTGVLPNVVFEPPDLLTLMIKPNHAATPAPCSMTFRHLASDSLTGIPDYFADQYEDQCLLAKLLLKRRALVIDDCLAKYRQHGRSLTALARARGEYAEGRSTFAEEKYLRWLQDYMREQGISDDSLTRAVQQRLHRYDHPIRFRLTSGPAVILRLCAEAMIWFAALLPFIRRERVREQLTRARWVWRRWSISRAQEPGISSKSGSPERGGGHRK